MFGRMMRLAAVIIVMMAASASAGTQRVELTPVASGYTTRIHSEVLDEDRDLIIGLPDNYTQSDGAFPVLYLLDGRFNFAHVQSTIAVLAAAGVMPKTIVVGVVNVDRHRDFTAVAFPGDPSSGGADRFLRFLSQELIPVIDANFRTLPHRTLVGHSLGGLLAFNAMISNPDLFQAIIAISPALGYDEREAQNAPVPFHVRAERFLDGRKSLPSFLYITMSGEEPTGSNTLLDRFLALLEDSAPSDLDWEMHAFPDEGHVTTVIRSTADGLRALYRGWSDSDILRSGDLDALRAHYATLSETLGYPIDLPEASVNTLGYRLLAEGRFDEAVAAFETNVSNHPESANAHDSLGEGLEAAGRLPGALVQYRKAIGIARKTDHPALETFESHLRRAEGRLAAN